jgi:hypothetical protein
VPGLKLDELNRIYEEAESADKEVFAEMRSNVLLVAGEHYKKGSGQKFRHTVRSRTDLSEVQKLRLTKNHIPKVVRHYVTGILSYAPGVMAAPQRPEERQDQKAAEMNQSVIVDAKSRYKIRQEQRYWVRDFVEIGEVCVKLFWDPNAGDFLGYEHQVDEMGQPQFDEAGQPVPDETLPRFSGAFVWKRIFGANLLRQVGSGDMKKSKCWIVREMVDIEDLKFRYRDDPAKLKTLTESGKEDFVVFDSDRANYERTQKQVLWREFYWPPSGDYPEGWYSMGTSSGVFEEGKLPGGKFPLVWKGFDEYPTTCRGRSPIKIARPFQAEINRASSQVAMHQITIGDDKVLYQTGTKLQPGALLPGVRGISYAGTPPTILPGRDGGQYLPYIESQISEMYSVLMLQEEGQEKGGGQTDPWSMHFRSLVQQKRFSEYGEKFEEFLCELFELFLSLAKIYYSDDMLIMAVGRNERVNIAEFRKTTPLSYAIKLEPREDTLETQFGKQLTLNHVLQYVGPNLGKDDIGKILCQMPFGDWEEAFSDFTLDYTCVKNDMLAMERGQMPPFGNYDNHEYSAKKLTARMRESDFQYLHPRVQQLYQARVAWHEKMIEEQRAKLLAAQNDFIPATGAMIACDMYIPNPDDPGKPAKRVRVPYTALDWLVKRLEAQGQSLAVLEHANKGMLSEMADHLVQRGPGGQSATQQPPMPYRQGPTSPVGVSG